MLCTLYPNKPLQLLILQHLYFLYSLPCSLALTDRPIALNLLPRIVINILHPGIHNSTTPLLSCDLKQPWNQSSNSEARLCEFPRAHLQYEKDTLAVECHLHEQLFATQHMQYC